MSLRERFAALPAGRQLQLAIAGGVGLSILLGALYFTFIYQPYSVLFADLRPADAATIKAELDRSKTPYRLARGGTTILAPKDIVDSTRLDVMSKDLPLKGMVGFELFNKSDIGLTEFAQKINYQRALQGELARTIMTLDAVDSARVHLSMPDPTLFREDRRPPKASVMISPREGRQMDIRTVRGVQRLIAAAVPDLELANVVVLDANGGVLAGGSESARPTPAGPASSHEAEAIEQYYAARVKRALDLNRPGLISQVDVRVQETLDHEALRLWTPQDRDFAISVSLGAAAAVSAEAERLLRSAAAAAVDLDESRGDTIRLAVSEATPDASGAEFVPLTPAKALPPSRAGAAGDPIALPLIAIIVVLLVLTGTLTLLRRRRGAAMTSSQRDTYVRRFNDLLDEREANVAPRS